MMLPPARFQVPDSKLSAKNNIKRPSPAMARVGLLKALDVTPELWVGKPAWQLSPQYAFSLRREKVGGTVKCVSPIG
jgi:hypothetical protein